MRIRPTAALLAIGASLVGAGPAMAASYTVVGTADSNDPQGCQQLQPELYQCDTLRRAVIEANLSVDADSIVLGSGTYTLSAGQLTISSDMIITGTETRSTIVQAGSGTRVFEIDGSATVQLVNMTIQGGSAAGGFGGNIVVEPAANLALYLVRVTGGVASSGAGISNSGTLAIQNSLIDDNHGTGSGGGIYNDGSVSIVPELTVLDSTIAGNSAEVGGGIASDGGAQNVVEILQSTIARNSPSGISLQQAQQAEAHASILADNSGSNCGSIPLSGGQFSIESGTDCGLDPGDNNLQSTDPGLAATLSDQGGPTDVLTIPATSPAVDFVRPCFYPVDQRGFVRYTTQGDPCDAGAYEQSATGDSQPPPPPPPEPTPEPTPAPPTVPTATPTPEPTPTFNQTVVAEPVRGTVTVRIPGSNRFVELNAANGIPFGSIVDTRKGRVELTTLSGPGGTPQQADFFDGLFKVTQRGKFTELQLTEALDCKKAKKASAAAKKPKTRKLWGDGKGQFRTRGQYSAATIRGTKWLVQDTCTTTLTKVTEGSVNVLDLVRNKTIVVRKGKTHVARAKK